MRTPSTLELIAYFEHIMVEAEKEKSPHEADWKDNIRLYTDSYDFGDKMDWQTQIKDPITDNLLIRLTNFFSRTLIGVENKYYTINHKDDTIASGLESIVSGVVRDNNLPSKFSDAFKLSLLTAPYIQKVAYEYDIETYPTFDGTDYGTEEQTIGRTRINNVPPFNIWLDPEGEGYIIERKKMALGDFIRVGRANGWKSIDSVRLNSTIKTSASTEEPESNNFSPTVEVFYVYSKFITNLQGETIDDNGHFIIARVNGKTTAVLYEKNILPKGMFPYVVGFPMKVLVGRYGRGYISKLKSLLLSYIEGVNLIMDQFTLATLGVWELDTSLIPEGQKKLYGSLVPGRVYPKSGQGKALDNVFKGVIDQSAINVLFFIDRLIQNRSFQNEFFQGSPTAKGRPTASEVSIKTGESASFFSDIANELERNIFEPLFELILATELIYMNDDEHVDISNYFESESALKDIQSKQFDDRIDYFRESQIEVRGISGKVIKLSNFNKLIQILNVFGNIPALQSAIDPEKFARKVFESIDESPDEILNLELLAQLGDNQAQPDDSGVSGGIGADLSPEQIAQQIQGAAQGQQGV